MGDSPQLTGEAKTLIDEAIGCAERYSNMEVFPVHFAFALISAGNGGGATANGDRTTTVPLLDSVISKAGFCRNQLIERLEEMIKELPTSNQSQPEPEPSDASGRILVNANDLAVKHDSPMDVKHLFFAILRFSDDEVLKIFQQYGVTEAALEAEQRSRISQTADTGAEVVLESAPAELGGLREYAEDITARAKEFDPIIGRGNVIMHLVTILGKRKKRNPVLIAEPGVGKTAIVEALAQRIANGRVPPRLQNTRIFALNIGSLLAGAKHRGDYEERIESVLDDVKKEYRRGFPIILFIDELHLIVTGRGAEGGGIDAANLLKPMLARDELQCIGATTLNEYRQYIETDAALERRFVPVFVGEPDVDKTTEILRGIRNMYEEHHRVTIEEAALRQAAVLAQLYLTERRLPDSAIDLMDEACSRAVLVREGDKLQHKVREIEEEFVALQRRGSIESQKRLHSLRTQKAEIEDDLLALRICSRDGKGFSDGANDTARDVKERKTMHNGQRDINIVTPEDVAQVVTSWTGIPVARLTSTEKETLQRLEEMLGNAVIGQPDAVEAVVDAMKLSRSGLSNPDRPIASFLMTGPTGTGKTLMAKTLANVLFNSPNAMIRVDASEYSSKNSISRLIGASPGYIGYEQAGQLTEYVRRRPYSIVLIDEIEKACDEFFDLFLQVLDDGRLTDGQGRTVNFKNTIIMMTSNLGGHFLKRVDDGRRIPHTTEKNVTTAIRSRFSAEFINRFDQIVFFRALSRDKMHGILNLRLSEIQERLVDRNATLAVDAKVKEYILSIGFSQEYGARPLDGVIRKILLKPLSDRIIAGKNLDGKEVHFRLQGPALGRSSDIPDHEDEEKLELINVNPRDVERTWGPLRAVLALSAFLFCIWAALHFAR